MAVNNKPMSAVEAVTSICKLIFSRRNTFAICNEGFVERLFYILT